MIWFLSGRAFGACRRRAVVASMVSVFTWCGSGPALAADAAPGSVSPSARVGVELIDRLRAAVVRIDATVPDEAPSAASLGAQRIGSGVLIDSQLVLTIGYLLLEADQIMVTTSGGRRIPGSVAGYDHETGFGLIRTVLPLDGKPLSLGDSDRLVESQRVLTIGHSERAVTELLVVSRRPFAGGWEYLLDRAIYTFPPVNNWSGSALVSEEGDLVGVGSLILNNAAGTPRAVPGNLFVPINLLKPVLTDLVERGRRGGVVQPWLGLSTELVRGHLMVTRVAPNGPADRAGVETGDIIVGVDADKVATQIDFYRRVWATGSAGAVISLRLLKGGDIRDVPVKSMDRMDFLRKPSGV